MIPKELQDVCFNKYNSEKWNFSNIIFLEGLYREQDFENAFPQFVKQSFHRYRDMATGTEWIMKKADEESCCGVRIKRAIIDSRISEEIFRRQILPACGNYCIRMEFFD
ncbi:MAG: hypothetical protein NC218_09430 [Acetobacter sp.]|nr:hypothetical protein [Acetobacter sp.]